MYTHSCKTVWHWKVGTIHKMPIMIWYALHDDLLLIVQFVYIFKIRISGAGGAVGGTASSCLNGRRQRSEGLLPRSPCRRPGRWPRRCHLLKQILCGSYQSITIAARWATYKNILHFWAVKYTFLYHLRACKERVKWNGAVLVTSRSLGEG